MDILERTLVVNCLQNFFKVSCNSTRFDKSRQVQHVKRVPEGDVQKAKPCYIPSFGNVPNVSEESEMSPLISAHAVQAGLSCHGGPVMLLPVNEVK